MRTRLLPSESGVFERREPRCHICRDEVVRVRANELLEWHGVRIPLGRGRARVIGYADVLRGLNYGRGQEDLITYDSLWVHAKRHYDLEGIATYWTTRVNKELRNALRGGRLGKPMEYL